MIMINGKPVMAQWDKRTQRYVPFTGQAVSKPNANPFGGILSGTGSPLFGQ